MIHFHYLHNSIKTSQVLFVFIVCLLCFNSCDNNSNAPVVSTKSMNVYYLFKHFGNDETRMMKNNDTITVAIGDSLKFKVNQKSYNSCVFFYDNNNAKVTNQGDSIYTFTPKNVTTTYIESFAYDEKDTLRSDLQFYVKIVPKVYNFTVRTDPEYDIDAADDATKQHISDEIGNYGFQKGTYVTLSYKTLSGGDLTIKPLASNQITGYFLYTMPSDDMLLGYNNQVYKYTFSKEKIYDSPCFRLLDLDLTDIFKKKYPNKVNKVVTSVEVNVSEWYNMIP